MIFSEVVGLVAQVFAKGGDFFPGLVFDDDSVAGGPRVAASTAVAVGDEVVGGGSFAGLEERARDRGHAVEFTTAGNGRAANSIVGVETS